MDGIDPTGRGDLIDFARSVGRAIVAVPTVGELAIEALGCALGLADTALTFAKGDWPTPPGAAATAIACVLYEIKSAVYIAAAIP